MAKLTSRIIDWEPVTRPQDLLGSINDWDNVIEQLDTAAAGVGSIVKYNSLNKMISVLVNRGNMNVHLGIPVAYIERTKPGDHEALHETIDVCARAYAENNSTAGTTGGTNVRA